MAQPMVVQQPMQVMTVEGGVTQVPMQTMQPMQPTGQVVTVIQQPADTLENRLRQRQCCCGCDARAAAQAIAIITLIIAVLTLISILTSDTYFDDGFGVAYFISQVLETIAILALAFFGISSTCNVNTQYAQIAMILYLVLVGFTAIDLVILIIWCLIIPWLFYFLIFPMILIGLWMGLFVWFYFIAKAYYEVLVGWDAQQAAIASGGVVSAVPVGTQVQQVVTTTQVVQPVGAV